MGNLLRPVFLLAAIVFLLPSLGPAGSREDLKTADQLRCAGRHQEAIDLCTRTIESETGDPQLLRNAYMQRAFNRGRLGRHEKALADMTKVVELRPDLWSSYSARARTHRQAGNLDGAIEDFSKALDLKPDSAGILEDRGDCYAEKGRREKALADYQAAMVNSRNIKAIKAKIDALK